jgi:streptogramin lyase
VITTVAGTGEAAWTGDGGPGVAAGLHWPTALQLDADGNLFIADTFNHSVRRLAVDGTITTVAGSGSEGSSGDGGPAIAARLSQPFGVTVDDEGNVYIADRGNFKVRRVTPDGVIDTFAGTGVEGASGDDGPATEATFGYLARVALDEDRLLIADQSNALVRSVVLR